MKNGWTAERRKQQAIMIQAWKPWQQSTGPKTIKGKMRSSSNACKGKGGGELREAIVNLSNIIKNQRNYLSKF